jgi:hypothetical protein
LLNCIRDHFLMHFFGMKKESLSLGIINKEFMIWAEVEG